MKIVVFLNNLGLGGTEKAACRWAAGLAGRGHTVTALALQEGPRRRELEQQGVGVRVVASVAAEIVRALRDLAPEVIHAHVPGYPHVGDVLGEAMKSLSGIAVVQTNIFGKLENPREGAWTD